MEVLHVTSQGVTKRKLRLREMDLLAQDSKWQKLDSNPGSLILHYF